MGIKGQEEGRTLCSKFTTFLYEFRDASKSPFPPLLMVSHDRFRVDNISPLSCVDSMSGIWEDTLILGMHRGWISAFVLLAYKSSLQGRELPPEKLRFFFYHNDTNCRSRNENNEKTKIKFCSADNF